LDQAITKEVEVVFFVLSGCMNSLMLEEEYEKRDLEPADPYSLTAVNMADPSFSDKHPNGTIWQPPGCRIRSMFFNRHENMGRRVMVGVHDYDFHVGEWCAGIRK